jgi:hypothetical protein
VRNRVVRIPAQAVQLQHLHPKVTARAVGGITATVRNRLRRIQYRPELITAFLGQTGLALEPEPP